MYLNRIHTATFLPFIAYNTDNQLITDTTNVLAFHPKSNLISLTVLAQKNFNNHDSNRIQAQEERKHTEEIP